MTEWTRQRVLQLRQRSVAMRTQVLADPDPATAAAQQAAAEQHAAAEGYAFGWRTGVAAGHQQDADPRHDPGIEV